MDLRDFHFKLHSLEWYIARDLLETGRREQTIRNFADRVGVTNPFIFRENSGGYRTDKPLTDQFRLFIYKVNTTINKMEEFGWSGMHDVYTEKNKWISKERQWVRFRTHFINNLIEDLKEEKVINEPVEDVSDREAEIEDDKIVLQPLPPNETDEYGNIIVEYIHDDNGYPKKVFHTHEITTEQEIQFFYARMLHARAFVQERELSGQYLDFISTRAIKDGCKAIAYGISAREALEAVTKTWPVDTKNEFRGWRTPWVPIDKGVIDVERYPNPLEGAHRYLGYVTRLAKARIPIMLVGPSGCGKSFLARDLSDVLEMTYGELPLTAGATPSWLVGAETITGYKSRPFVDIYRNGGIFCFEEIDAADPNMLLLVNNALANDALTNPVTGEEIPKHKDFIPVATANTWGLGANRQFTGRERLDAATLDRWRVGRVEMDYDQKIEDSIVEDWINHAKPRVKKAVIKK